MATVDPHSNVQFQQTEGIRTLLGNPKRAIIKLSIPMIIAMSVQTIYNFVDALWVSGLGADALSAVGFFFPFFFMIMAISTGLGVGGSSAVSRRIGANDKAGADKVAAHTMIMMLIAAILVTLPFFIFIKQIFLRMGAGAISIPASQYGRIMFTGTIIIFFANIASALLRGEGDMNRAMYAMMIGAGLNIILDPIFIYTLRLGVAGAAWATLISLFISATILFYWICIRRNTFISIRLTGFRFQRTIFNDIMRVAIPSTAMQLTMSFSILILNLIAVKAGGTDGVAVFNTGWRVVMFATLPLIGMATAVTAVTGAAFGGAQYQKLDTAYLYAIKIGVIIELCIAAATYVLAPLITRLFTRSPEAARIAPDLMMFLRIMFVFYPMTALGMLSSSVFQGTGKGLYSLIMTLVRTIILAAPAAYILAIILNIGLSGVWWGIVIGNSLGGIISFTWGRIYVTSLKKSKN
ncbi:MATE family efflux transporter [candidate division WOR-3 bacterium RBG_13_43_14]|uniref:MATE family efflux transporter n=1 Tax=candidate division WOR-3 bacterium RBG_13_43_14 TaxID=1802590 RepID=A0A1F4UAC5_UNCW3|nr:MAG: MATE family efflux transporter [candidate division WOR-3 bacterium RBG_13_43_14]